MESKEEFPLLTRRPDLERPGETRRVSTGSETPLTALVNSLLHPLLATATLIGCVYAYGEQFTALYLLLTVLTFFISSQVFDEIDILVPWSSFHLTRLIRGIVVGWAIVAAILSGALPGAQVQPGAQVLDPAILDLGMSDVLCLAPSRRRGVVLATTRSP